MSQANKPRIPDAPGEWHSRKGERIFVHIVTGGLYYRRVHRLVEEVFRRVADLSPTSLPAVAPEFPPEPPPKPQVPQCLVQSDFRNDGPHWCYRCTPGVSTCSQSVALVACAT